MYFNKSAFESGILDLELMVHASAFKHFPLEEILLHCLQKLASWPLQRYLLYRKDFHFSTLMCGTQSSSLHKALWEEIGLTKTLNLQTISSLLYHTRQDTL